MILFPYQIDINFKGRPYLTYIICLICVFAFIHQEYSFKQYLENLHQYCNSEFNDELDSIINNEKPNEHKISCENFLDQYINLGLEKKDNFFALNKVASFSEKAKKSIPPHATQEWVYISNGSDHVRIFTSSIAHSDWKHLALNLVFFYSFASAAELIMGPVFFMLVFIFSCISTATVYSFGAFGFDNSYPTLGLSAIVTTYMAILALLFPHKMIRMFYWFIIFTGIFRIPLLIVVASFLFLDIYGIRQLDDNAKINYLSHISGSATGGFLGMLYLLINHKKLKEFY